MLTKPAVEGRTKTRLGSSLGMDVAASAHHAFLDDLCALVASLKRRLDGLSFELCVDDDAQPGGGQASDQGLVHPSLLCLSQVADLTTAQVMGSLGAKLRDVFVRGFEDGCGSVVVIGSDSPTMPQALVEEAFERLDAGADVVFGPSMDGGYYLVGVSRWSDGLFDGIPWSTAEVLRTSVSVALGLGLRVDLCPIWYDVDELLDLRLLKHSLCDDPSFLPARGLLRRPHTASWLSKLELAGEGG